MLLLNCNILFTSDPTLTPENMLLSTAGVVLPAGVQLPKVMGYEYPLDMPRATYNHLVSTHGTGDEGRKHLFSEFLSHHPYPRWEVVVQFLEMLKQKGKARAGLAQEVKEKYLTSE